MTSRVLSVILLLLLCAPASSQGDRDAELTRRISDAILETSTIKVGMTRGDLMRVFTIEGGISTRSQRTYVYRRCPYIKVDVEFDVEHLRDSQGRIPLPQADEDVIRHISRPYLAWTIAD
jgi:hypothetical protein